VRGGHGVEQTAVDRWQRTGKMLSLIDDKKKNVDETNITKYKKRSSVIKIKIKY
jgi:hypothetical protein